MSEHITWEAEVQSDFKVKCKGQMDVKKGVRVIVLKEGCRDHFVKAVVDGRKGYVGKDVLLPVNKHT